MLSNRKLQEKSVNEIIQIIDIKEEKYFYIKEKFEDQADLVDCEVRNTFISRVSYSQM